MGREPVPRSNPPPEGRPDGHGSALRGRPPARSEGAAAGALAPSRRAQPRKRRSAAAATRPASTSERAPGAGRAVRHHGDDEDAAAPDDEPGVVARAFDPAGLVQRRRHPAPVHHAADLAAVAALREQIEQVARVGRREPRRAARRAAPGRALASQTARASPARSSAVVRLPIAPVGLRVDAERDAAGGDSRVGRRRRADGVAAVHVGVDEPDRPHQWRSRAPSRRSSSLRSSAEPSSPPRCPRREHPPQQTVERRSRRRLPLGPRERGDRDRQLERRRRRQGGAAFHGGAGPGREVLRRRCRSSPGTRARARRTSRQSRASSAAGAKARRAARGSPRTCSTERPARRPRRSTFSTRTVVSPAGRATWTVNASPLERAASRRMRPSALITTRTRSGRRDAADDAVGRLVRRRALDRGRRGGGGGGGESITGEP